MAIADSLNVEAQFTTPRTEILGIPFVELFTYPIDRRAVSLVAPAICRRHEVLPIGIVNGRLVLAMADPGNVVAMDDVRAAARMQVEVVAAEHSDLLAAIDRLLRAMTSSAISRLRWLRRTRLPIHWTLATWIPPIVKCRSSVS